MISSVATTSARRAGTVVLVTALGLGVLTGPAQARWTPAHRISDRTHANRDPRAAGDGRGAVLVAWNRIPADPSTTLTNTVMLRRRDRQGHWGALTRVSPALLRGGVSGVAMNAHGDGVVLIVDRLASGQTRITARRVGRSGHVGRARVVARGMNAALNTAVMDGAGDVIVAWSGETDAWHVTVLRAGGVRTQPSDLPTGAGSVLSEPTLTSEGRHDVALAWSEGSRVHTQRVAASGALGTDLVVSDPTESGQAFGVSPHLADDGTLAVTWFDQDAPDDSPAFAAWRRPDDTVAHRRITATNAWVTGLWSTADSRGRLQVAWLSGSGTFGPGYTRHVTPAGALGHRHRVTHGTLGIVMSAERDGSGLITWLPVGPDERGRSLPYSSGGRLRSTRTAPIGTTLTPVGHGRYLTVVGSAGTGGQAAALAARIGP